MRVSNSFATLLGTLLIVHESFSVPSTRSTKTPSILLDPWSNATRLSLQSTDEGGQESFFAQDTRSRRLSFKSQTPAASEITAAKWGKPSNMPRNSSGAIYNWQWFVQWKKSLADKMKAEVLPQFDSSALSATMAEVKRVFDELEEAKTKREDIVKKKGDEASKEAANSEIERLKEKLADAETACMAEAEVYLKRLDSGILSESFDDSDLLTAMVLSDRCKPLALYCEAHPDRAEKTVEYLEQTDLLREFAASGGPRQGKWELAFELYEQIMPEVDDALAKKHPVLRRLALAVILEFAGDMNSKVHTTVIDPVERYRYFVQCFLNGELDPAFSQFSTWALRMVVDSDATNDELTWGRESLRNYRPDILFDKEEKWKYCRIVKSDVSYAAPTWVNDERSYENILSGGGKCGPRAWYGRFISKAFGTPTWGCKQPGHAALVKYTSDGWETCLGAGIDVSSWEEVGGPVFASETRARSNLGREEAFWQQVGRLEALSRLQEEDPKKTKGVYRHDRVDPDCFWSSLSLLQRRRLSGDRSGGELPYPRTGGKTMAEELIERQDECESILTSKKRTVVPAALFSKPKRANQKVRIHSSFSGGTQVIANKDATVEYTLQANDLVPASIYRLSLLVCTVHVDEEPLTLAVNGGPAIEIPLPYTKGMFAETGPVEFTLTGPTLILSFVRPNARHTLVMKQLSITAA